MSDSEQEQNLLKRTKKKNNFSAHLKKISNSKKRADDLLKEFSDSNFFARASLAVLWEIVFDSLCESEDLSLAQINTLAGVVHKLSSVKLAGAAETRSLDGVIDDEELSKIEEKLRLL